MTELIDTSLPLAESAYRRLRDDIIACRLEPGQRVTERALAKDFGLGVSPIRDALTRLDHEGLVRTIPRKGYQVAPLTLKVVDELFTFWQMIGPEVARLGVTSASAEELDRVVDDLNEAEKLTTGAHGAAELLRIVELGDDVFTTFAAAAGNSYLAATYAKLSGQVFRVWALIVSDSDLITPLKLMNETDWSDVIRRRDGDALAQYAREYIHACKEHVERTLVRWPSVMASEVVPLRPR